MAANYRQIVRSKLRAVLVAEFNTVNAAAAAGYGVPALDINFDYPSENFLMAQVDALGFEASNAAITPPGLVLYTSSAVDLKRQLNRQFSGEVLGHLDFYLMYRALRDQETAANSITDQQASWEPEVLADCVEDSALTVLRSQASTLLFGAANCNLIGYRCDRDPIQVYGDGFFQRVAITCGFSVHV